MKQIFFFFILCLSFSCNNSNTQDLKEVPTGMILIKGGEFLMGADNLVNFHKWHKWKIISQKCNIIVFDRHGYKKKSLNSMTFKRLNKKNLKFIEFDKVNISSSQLRKI